MERIARRKLKQELAAQLRRKALPAAKGVEDQEAQPQTTWKPTQERGAGAKRARNPEASSSSAGPAGVAAGQNGGAEETTTGIRRSTRYGREKCL